MNNIICYSVGVSTTLSVAYFLHTKARINIGEEMEHVLLNGHVSAKARQVAASTYSALADIATTVKTDGVQSGWEKLRLYRSEASETKAEDGARTDAPAVAPNPEEADVTKSEDGAASNPESDTIDEAQKEDDPTKDQGHDEPNSEPEPDSESEGEAESDSSDD